MVYLISVVEIISSIIAVLSLIFNGIAIHTILILRKEAPLTVGLGLVLIVATYDLIGPSVGIIQVLIIKSLKQSILKHVVTCQLLGTVETLVPFISSGAVALLSIERYMFIYHIKLKKAKIVLVLALHFALGFILAALAASSRDFKMASNRMICMTNPYNGLFGQIWYYSLLCFLLVHAAIIMFCYAKIMLLRRILSEKVVIPIKMTSRKQLTNVYLSSTNTTEYSLPIEFNADYTNDLNRTGPFGTPRSPSVASKSTTTTFKWYIPDRFIIKAIVLMMAYLICIIPCIVVMIYYAIQANTGALLKELDPELSAIMFLPLFSLSLINPILLLGLHTKASEKLKENLNCFLAKFK